MKKILALVLVCLMMFPFCACGEPDFEDELVSTFEENSDKTAQEIVDTILQSALLWFDTISISNVPTSPEGFSSAQITGYDECAMFKANSGEIPFIGYVFTLSEDTDKNDFIKTLEESADLNFKSGCTADKVIIESNGDKVLAVITPEPENNDYKDVTLSPQEETEDTMVVSGDEFVDEFADEF